MTSDPLRVVRVKDQDGDVIATLTLGVDGVVVLDPDNEMLARDLAVMDETGKVLRPKDGAAYLDALVARKGGSYWSVSEKP